jgi:hypothetical protein
MSNYNTDTVELRAFLNLPRFFILPTSWGNLSEKCVHRLSV